MKPMVDLKRHRQVMKNGVDIPEEAPGFAFPIQEVGIVSKTVWVDLPEGKIPFEAELFVNLPEDVRGIHMSRMEEVISDLYNQSFSDLKEYATSVARALLTRQRGIKSRVTLNGIYPHPTQTKVSQLQSIDSYELGTEVICQQIKNGFSEKILIWAGLYHITACPCTQEYNRVLFEPKNEQMPMPTHSQRSHTRLTMTVMDDAPSHADLVECLQEALHVTQDLQKRSDEAELVLTSHIYPQFVEDSVRQTAHAVGEKFGRSLPPSIAVNIESTSLESIHIHDVCCRIKTTLGKIR